MKNMQRRVNYDHYCLGKCSPRLGIMLIVTKLVRGWTGTNAH